VDYAVHVTCTYMHMQVGMYEICIGNVRCRLLIVFAERRKHKLDYYNGDACRQIFYKSWQSFENKKYIWAKEFHPMMLLTIP